MWFADVVLDAAWLGLAAWLGWLLVPVLARRGRPDWPAPDRDHLVAIAAGAAAALNLAQAAVVVAVRDGTGVSGIDRPLLGWMTAHRHAELTVAAKAVSLAGSPATWTVLAVAVVLWLAARRRWADAALVSVTGAGAVALVRLGKPLLDRSRPPAADHLVLETNESLPSGHALGSVVVLGVLTALVLGRVVSRAARGALLVAAALAVGLVGLSRLYLGVHWGTDVLAGWLLGGAWLTACLTVRAARSPREVTAPPPGTRFGKEFLTDMRGKPADRKQQYLLNLNRETVTCDQLTRNVG